MALGKIVVSPLIKAWLCHSFEVTHCNVDTWHKTQLSSGKKSQANTYRMEDVADAGYLFLDVTPLPTVTVNVWRNMEHHVIK